MRAGADVGMSRGWELSPRALSRPTWASTSHSLALCTRQTWRVSEGRGLCPSSLGPPHLPQAEQVTKPRGAASPPSKPHVWTDRHTR